MFGSGKAANEAIRSLHKQPVFNSWEITVEHAKRRMLPDDPRIKKSIYARNMLLLRRGGSYGYEERNPREGFR